MGAYFSKWLVFNGFLDIVPLGLAPIFGAELPGPKLTDFFEGPLGVQHRMCAWFFLTAGFSRFSAGYGGTAVAKNLATLSYIAEAVMFITEIQNGTTTFAKVASGIAIPCVCAGLHRKTTS